MSVSVAESYFAQILEGMKGMERTITYVREQRDSYERRVRELEDAERTLAARKGYLARIATLESALREVEDELDSALIHSNPELIWQHATAARDAARKALGEGK